MRVLLPNRSFRTIALCPKDTRERRKALRLSAVIKTIAGNQRTLREASYRLLSAYRTFRCVHLLRKTVPLRIAEGQT